MCRGIATKRQNENRGSATIELAVALPLVAVVMLAVAQISLVVWDQLRVTHAAREGARVLSITNDVGRASEAVFKTGSLAKSRTAVSVEPSSRPAGSSGRVNVSYIVPIVVPYMERFTGKLILHASVDERMERDPP